MAAVDLGGGRPKKKKGGLKRPKRRISIRNDLTPMVDIAFLLLIFYMVTTVFSSPLSMEISLPPKQDQSEPIIIGESRLLRMYVDKNDSLYYQIGEEMKQPEQVRFNRLGEIIEDKNRKVNKLVMVLKIDHAASYQMMVLIIDEIQKVERQINAELDAARERDPSITGDRYSVRFSLQDMNAWDEHVLQVVSEGGVVEL